MVYNLGLSAVAIQEKYNIISDTANEDQKIEANIKAIKIYLMCMFLNRADNLRYKQLKTELKNNYIVVMYGYPQHLLGVMKLLNNYIT